MDAGALRDLLLSKNTKERIRATESLDPTDPAHVPLLLQVLGDRTHFLATVAARKLAEDPPESVEPAVLTAYRARDAGGAASDPGCGVRTYLALAVGKLRIHPALDDMRRGITLRQWEYVGGVRTDTAVALRGNCALALSRLAPPDAARDIAVLLYDGAGDPLDRTLEARKAAARALGGLADMPALVALTLRLTHPEDENAEVLGECMEALVEAQDPRAVDLLEPFLRSDTDRLAAQAAVSIARTGDERAGPLLLATCERLRGDLLRAVALSLGAMRTDASQRALRQLAQSAREISRLAAVEALSAAPDPDSLALLEQIVGEDSSSQVREAAAAARR